MRFADDSGAAFDWLRPRESEFLKAIDLATRGGAVGRFDFRTDPLEEDENVLGVFYGSRGEWGSQFVVTNRRLLFGPLDTGLAEEILSFGLDKTGVPGTDFAKSVLERYAPRSSKAVWLRHVMEVRPTNNASLFRAPGMRIFAATQETIDLKIVHKPTAMAREPKNNVARDQAVALINSAASAARAAAGESSQ